MTTITPNNPAAAAANTIALGCLPELPAKGTFYINGTVKLKPESGCGFWSGKAFGSAPLGNRALRIVQLGKGPVLRLSGDGFICERMELVGDGKSPIVEIEGRDRKAGGPPSGRHRFRDVVFSKPLIKGGWPLVDDEPNECAIHCLGGYYDDKGAFQKYETQADNSIVEGCEFFVGTAFRSDNKQSVNWTFRDCVYNWCGFNELVLADLRCGGSVKIYGPEITHPRTTIFRVRDYSPNGCFLVARDVRVDRFADQEFRLTVLDVDQEPDKWTRWNVTANVFVATHKTAFDHGKLFKVGGKYYRDAPASLTRIPDEWNIKEGAAQGLVESLFDVRVDARPNK